MNALEVRSSLTVADWQAYQGAWAARLQRHSRLSRKMLLGVIAVALGLGCVLVLLAVQLRQPVPFVAVVIGACAAVLGIMINMRRIRGASQPDENGVILGPSRLRFDSEGMHLEKAHSQIRHGWPVFQEVTQSTEHLFVWIDRVAALIVPIRDLPAGLSAAQAAQQIRDLAAVCPRDAGAAIPDAGTEPTDALPTRAPAAIGSFWQTLARSLTLRTTDHPALAPNDRTLLAMGLIFLLLWLAVDFLTAPPESTFYVYGLLGVGWFASVIVLVAAIWARLSQPVVPLRSAFALALAFAPIATAFVLLILRYLPEGATLGALVLVAFYASGFGQAGLRSLTGRPQPRALFAGLAVMSLAAWFAQSQYVTPQFWYPPEDETFDTDESGDFMAQRRLMEALQFVQAEQIDSAVDAMDRPETLDTAAFFVGFAGMGEQQVFASEIALAAGTIAAGYDTARRSLLLVNDRLDLTSHPFASAPALRRALADVANRMDVDRDVLFLALSSHGAESGALAVSNLDMPLADLSAQEVADALDESGIRWRVVIVSACYSGQFIEPLRNDRTIVITASAADRTSFGCADDRDLTYFGEAFYRDALATTHDLRTAFQRAKAEITQREEREGIESSNPQAHFGAAIERRLRNLQTNAAPRP